MKKLILQTKDHSTIIKELADDREAIFYFTNGIQEKPYVPAETLGREASKYIEEKNIITTDIENAMKEAKEKYKDRAIFIIGSFYVYKKVKEIIA